MIGDTQETNHAAAVESFLVRTEANTVAHARMVDALVEGAGFALADDSLVRIVQVFRASQIEYVWCLVSHRHAGMA